MTTDEFTSFLPDKYKNCHKRLTWDDVGILQKILESNVAFKDYFKNKNLENKKLIIDYLQQEMDFSDDRLAFVELIGSGFTQDCLMKIIKTFYKENIPTFYFDLNTLNKPNEGLKLIFLPNSKINGLNIEVLSRALHGQTLGYEKVGSQVKPILENKEGNAFIQAGYDDYIRGVEEFTSRYMQMLYANFISNLSMDLFVKYFITIEKYPDDIFLDFLSNVPFAINGYNKEMKKYAPKLSMWELIQIEVFKKDWKQYSSNYRYSKLLSIRILKLIINLKKRIIYETVPEN